jgi:hypothetical protein
MSSLLIIRLVLSNAVLDRIRHHAMHPVVIRSLAISVAS